MVGKGKASWEIVFKLRWQFSPSPRKPPNIKIKTNKVGGCQEGGVNLCFSWRWSEI